MTRCFALAVVAGALCLGGCAKAPPKEFVSAEGKFKVRVRGTLKDQSQIAAGTNLKLFGLEERAGAYMVGYADLPIPDGESDAQTRTRLDNSQDGMVRAMKATLSGSSAATLDGKHPGRDVRADVPDGQRVVHARVYLVGRRLYQIMVVGAKSWVDSAEATQFLDSLTLTP